MRSCFDCEHQSSCEPMDWLYQATDLNFTFLYDKSTPGDIPGVFAAMANSCSKFNEKEKIEDDEKDIPF